MEYLDNVDDRLEAYHVRFHQRDTDISLDYLKTLFSNPFMCVCKYLVVCEIDHYHCYLDIKKSKLDELIDVVKNDHQEIHGNKYYSVSRVRNIRKCLKYICKDLYTDNWVANFSKEEVQYYHNISHKKFSTSEWDNSIEELSDDKRLSSKELFVSICELHQKYGKPIYYPRIKALVNTLRGSSYEFGLAYDRLD